MGEKNTTGLANLLDVQFDKARLFLVLPIQSPLGLLEEHLAATVPSNMDLGIDPSRYVDADLATVWEELPLKLSKDLHPSLGHVLGHDRNGTSAFWRLKPDAREDLNRRLGEKDCPKEISRSPAIEVSNGYGLSVQLSKAARERLGRPDTETYVPIRIASVEFYLSQTRFGQFVVELECGDGPVSAGLIAEVAHNLSHSDYSGANSARFVRLSSRREAIEGSQEDAFPFSFTLNDLAMSLVCPGHEAACIIDVPRAFSYTLATCQDRLGDQDRKELAARLARRLTADYSPHSDLEGVHFASPFETVTTACTCEGGATLVSSTNGVQFLEDFIEDTGKKIYLKLALLAHKELHDLVALSQGSAITIEHSHKFDDVAINSRLEKMRLVQERVLNYRLAHRFTLVGFGTNHNLVHAAWRDAMQTEQLLNDVSGDVREATAYLNAAHASLQAKRQEKLESDLLRKTSWLQAAFAFLATLEGMHVLMKLVSESVGSPSEEVKAAGQLAEAFGRELPAEASHSASLFAHAVPLGVALIAAILVWLFSRKGKHVGGH